MQLSDIRRDDAYLLWHLSKPPAVRKAISKYWGYVPQFEES